MNFQGYDKRGQRSLLNPRIISYGPTYRSILNYSTDARIDSRTVKDYPFVEDDILNRIQSIPDPLKKNLADTVITAQNQSVNNTKMAPDPQEFYYPSEIESDSAENPPSSRTDFYPNFTGITNFFSNFFGAISGAMFQKRAKSPVSQYYDCFDQDTDVCRERSPSLDWQSPKFEDQNKNGRAQIQFCTVPDANMNNCRTTVSNCENKLNAVRNLLTGKTAPNPPKFRSRRPRRVFVDPGSVEENYEDAFGPEDLVSLANDEYIEYFSRPHTQNNELNEVDAPKTKTHLSPIRETSEIVTTLPDVTEKEDIANSIVINKSVDSKSEAKPEVITSCEDKMARLKSLLQEKRKKNTKTNLNSTDSSTEPVKEETVIERPEKTTKSINIDKKHDKRYKNPNRLSMEKRKTSKLRKNIQEDMFFANEIDGEELSSVENSPSCKSTLNRFCLVPKPISQTIEEKEYFDEVKGRFRSTSTTDSEDSFQIVFTDSPKLPRKRKQSDCDSEDSFIVFEESPDSCYTSNDVFGEPISESDSDCSDSESEVSDSGCGLSNMCKMSHSFSRTVSDLTDDSLYVEDALGNTRTVGSVNSDEVDCAVRIFEEIPTEEIQDESYEEEEPAKPGLLLNEARKLQRKNQPAKTVTFSAQPPKVHVMRVWSFAARQARAGHWERHAIDRERFKRRIADVDMAVSWVLKPQHRSRVMFQRFMPWWNAQRRKEIAEKKQREEEEKIKKKAEEEERLRKEAEEEGKIDNIGGNDEIAKNGIVDAEKSTEEENPDAKLKEIDDEIARGKSILLLLRKGVKKNGETGHKKSDNLMISKPGSERNTNKEIGNDKHTLIQINNTQTEIEIQKIKDKLSDLKLEYNVINENIAST